MIVVALACFSTYPFVLGSPSCYWLIPIPPEAISFAPGHLHSGSMAPDLQNPALTLNTEVTGARCSTGEQAHLGCLSRNPQAESAFESGWPWLWTPPRASAKNTAVEHEEIQRRLGIFDSDTMGYGYIHPCSHAMLSRAKHRRTVCFTAHSSHVDRVQVQAQSRWGTM